MVFVGFAMDELDPKYFKEFSPTSNLAVNSESGSTAPTLREVTLKENSGLSTFARYSLVGSHLEVTVSRDPITQLILIELFANSSVLSRHTAGTGASDRQLLGRWQITAYQSEKQSFSVGSYTIKASLSPFSFELRFYQKMLGLAAEVANFIVKPKVLRPGDIPVKLSGTWQTDSANLYDGFLAAPHFSHIVNRYVFNNTNVELVISRSKVTSDIAVQLTLEEEDGIKRPIFTWSTATPVFKDSELKLGQYVIKVKEERHSLNLKFVDRTIGIFPVEIGYAEVDLRAESSAKPKLVPLYLGGSWTELGINFDKHFTS